MFSILRGRELILLGERLEFFTLEIPRALVGRSLAGSQLRSRTGLNVIAVQSGGASNPAPAPDLPLPSEGYLLAIGTHEQRQRFAAEFEA